jgi:hypothetical protein
MTTWTLLSLHGVWVCPYVPVARMLHTYVLYTPWRHRPTGRRHQYHRYVSGRSHVVAAHVPHPETKRIRMRGLVRQVVSVWWPAGACSTSTSTILLALGPPPSALLSPALCPFMLLRLLPGNRMLRAKFARTPKVRANSYFARKTESYRATE